MVNQSVYFAYLRKSREDRDAEMRGEGETLERHRKILSNLADRMGITVSAWYQEVVSGETKAGVRLRVDLKDKRWAMEIKWGQVKLIRELDKQPDMSRINGGEEHA